jgi:hypothetical protein
MKATSSIVLGIFVLVAAIGHALLVRPTPRALVSGYVQGDVWKQEGNGIAKLKCNGFKVELYEAFVVIHVDKSKEPTWTGDYVLTIPWNKIENLTMLPQDAK